MYKVNIIRSLQLVFLFIVLIPCLSASAEKRFVVPSPILFMYGYNDNYDELYKSKWANIIETFNVIEGITADANFVKSLRSKGKIFAYHVSLPTKDNRSVESLVKLWSEPFENNLKGKLPSGFDAICIDEFHSNQDGSEESKVAVEALRQIREKYKDRLIFASGVWRLGEGGPTSLYGKKDYVYDDILNAIYKYADVFVLENYHKTSNPHFKLFNSMAKNIESRRPGLLKKTIYALYISQTKPVKADDKLGVDFYDFVTKQIEMIKTGPLTKGMNGIAFWVAYRAKPETLDKTPQWANKFKK